MTDTTTMTTLQKRYRQTVVPALEKELHVKNIHAVPRVTKVVLNVGAGKMKEDTKKVEAIAASVGRITGQKPVFTKAKKSISNFKIRKGMPVGVVATLRGRRMYDFLERLISATLPRTRDFQGLPLSAFDGRGNYTIALREQTVFPEISGELAELVHGLQITICTTGKDAAATEALLRGLGLPLKHR